MHSYDLKPWQIWISPDLQNPGKLRGEGPTFCVNNVPVDRLEAFVTPFLGYVGTITVNVRLGDPKEYDIPNNHPRKKALVMKDKKYAQQVTERVLANSNWNVFNKFTHPAFDNWYENLGAASDCASKIRTMDDLAHLLDAQDVIFLGAGPTLKKHRELITGLAKQSDGPIIIAGGSAIRVLCKWGVSPDFCMAIDPHDSEYDLVFKDLDKKWLDKQTWITDLMTETRSFRRIINNGDLMYVNPGGSGLPIFKKLLNMPQCSQGTIGVSTFMMCLAEYCKLKSLTLVGVDLAFEGEDSYACGTKCEIYDSEKIEFKNRKTRQLWLNEAIALGQLASGMSLPVNRLDAIKGLPIDSINNIGVADVPRKLAKPLPDEIEQAGINFVELQTAIEIFVQDMEEKCEDTTNHKLFNDLLIPYYNINKARLLRGANEDKTLLDDVLNHHLKNAKNLLDKLNM